MNWEPLIAAAREARERAHAPYSGFKVGAAVLTEDGRIFAGCNVENRTFGLTICAERTAIVRSVAEGGGKPVAVAVVTDTSPPALPCGMCRETLAEFAPDLRVLSTNLQGEGREVSLSEIFPEPFVFPPRPAP